MKYHSVTTITSIKNFFTFNLLFFSTINVQATQSRMLLTELYGMDVIRGNSEDYEDKLGNRKLMKLDLVITIDNICTQTPNSSKHASSCQLFEKVYYSVPF